MSHDVVVLGDNFNPPVVCPDTAKNVYECVKTDEFEVAKFNALLMGIVVYLDAHGIEYADKALPWAESVQEA